MTPDKFPTLSKELTTKFTVLFLTYYITVSIPTCFDPQGIVTREPMSNNTA
jgi:hypothetical protein